MKKKIKKIPAIDFEKNKQLQKVFRQYDKTFSMTLDCLDYWKKRHLNKFQNFTWRLMRKSLRKVSPVARQIVRFKKKEFLEKQKAIEMKKAGQKPKFESMLFVKEKKFKRAVKFVLASPLVAVK